MAIIYTYPTGIVYGDDRLIVSEMDDQGNPTKNITVAALATFITGTGTGTGTTGSPGHTGHHHGDNQKKKDKDGGGDNSSDEDERAYTI